MLSSREDFASQDCFVQASLDLDALETDQLACMAQSGHPRAFAVLASRLRPRLLVVLSKRLGYQSADAEDVVQETLTKAWRYIDSYDVRRSFKAWLFTIALRRATDHLRSQKRRAHHTQCLQPVEASAETAMQAAIDREAAANLWQTAKRELTDQQYVALWLRYAEDLSVNEIAQAIGKSRVAIRVLLHRARTKLQPHFATEHRNDET